MPTDLAVDLPSAPDRDDSWLAEQAACLGIAGITGYRSVFADGPVTGLHVLIHGALGGVGAIATQMARRDGAIVIAVVREGQDERARTLGASHVLDSARPDLVDAVRALAPGGVNRIADVDFAAHIELNAQVVAIARPSPRSPHRLTNPSFRTGRSVSPIPACGCSAAMTSRLR